VLLLVLVLVLLVRRLTRTLTGSVIFRLFQQAGSAANCGDAGVGADGNGSSSIVLMMELGQTSGGDAPPWRDVQTTTVGNLQKRGLGQTNEVNRITRKIEKDTRQWC